MLVLEIIEELLVFDNYIPKTILLYANITISVRQKYLKQFTSMQTND